VPEREVFEGEISVLAALQAGVRVVDQILLDTAKRADETEQVRTAARAAKVPVMRIARAKIDAHAGGSTHGGIIALCGARTWRDAPGLLRETRASGESAPWLAVLDGIEDPFNFGQSVRALYAAGAAGLLMRTRTWRGGDGIIARASAGASELMPTAAVDSLEQACALCRDAGFVIAMTARDRRAESLYDAELQRPMLLLIGGEKRGLKRALLDSADLLLRIPYKRRFPHSLGSAGSASILAFEMMRRRLTSPPSAAQAQL
jgi:23S rRNA (guanosine2251-2'-O)-methyltransferase